MKKVYLIILILVVNSACTQNIYKVDFRKVKFPEKVPQTDISSRKWPIDAWLSKASTCYTDKSSYKFGETIEVTVRNDDSDTVFFFPNKIEVTPWGVFMDPLTGQVNNDEVRKYLISETPAISGYSEIESPSFVSLHIFSIYQSTASAVGLESFQQYLAPGEKMTFYVKMPDRPDTYRLFFQKYSHEPNKVLAGSKRYYVSNSFEIVGK